MKLVTAIINPHVLDDVRTALAAKGVAGITVGEVVGHGRQKGKTEVYRGTEYTIDLLPKTRIEVICDVYDAESIADTIVEAARTGRIGDGKVWITEVDRVIRIRTGETGAEAL